MSKKLKPVIPLVMIVSALIAIMALLVVNGRVQEFHNGNSEKTRAAVESAILPELEKRYQGLDDATLMASIEKVASVQYVSAVWLFTADGRPLSGKGCIKSSAVTNTRGGSEVKSVLAGLPDNLLKSDQKGAILALAALRAEGEHNDIFRHMVRPLISTSGSTIGWLAIAYNVSTTLDASPALSYKLMVLAIPLSVLIYKLSLLLWIFWDAKEHGERAWIWMSFALLGDLVALIAYLLVPRPGNVAITTAQ